MTENKLRSAVILACSVIVLISGITLPLVLGMVEPGYSSAHQYISELGADGARRAGVINWLGFLPVGICTMILMGHYALTWPGPLLKAGAVFMLGVGIGYLGAALFHCDAGCPATGSFKQNMHNLTGLVEYGGAIIGLSLLVVGFARRKSRIRATLTLITLVAVWTGFIMMLNSDLLSPIGAWQRLVDYSLFVWMFSVTFFSERYPHQLHRD